MIKEEAVQLRKKIECNLHGNQIRYKCECPNCQTPYICQESECIELHFHDSGKLTLTKFNTTLWESRFQEAENVINSNTLKVKEENLTKMVEYFNQSLVKIMKKMHKFEDMKFKLCESNEGSYENQFQRVNELLSLGSSLDRKMDRLRSKVNEDDFLF